MQYPNSFTRGYPFVALILLCLAGCESHKIARLAPTGASSGSGQTFPTIMTNSPSTSDTPYAVVERDGNSATWERTTYEQNSSGELLPRVHRFQELATGLNFQDPQTGEWMESKEQIDISPNGGAQAVQGQHKVYFPYDIYDGVIEVVTPAGQHLQSRPFGIEYYDGTNSVLIAQLKHSIGQLLPSGNQVIYTNAFSDFAADLVCTYRKSGFESDLVLREQPPATETFGLTSDGSQLQLLTEFFNTPEPEQIATPTTNAPSQNGNLGVGVRNIPDSTLRFGAMRMIHGKAFAVPATASRIQTATGQASQRNMSGPGDLVSVSKTWATIEGRTFLIESVPVEKIRPEIETLPTATTAVSTPNPKDSILHRVSSVRFLPAPRVAQIRTNSMHLAQTDIGRKAGVVLDYNIINANTNNVIFQSDTTYFVTGFVFLGGNNIIEGGTVIKFIQTNTTASALIVNGGTVTCLTAPYRPAIFTSRDDNTVGEVILGSTGTPVTDDQNEYLQTWEPNPSIHDLRMLYAYSGYSAFLAVNLELRDLQFVHTAWPIWLNGTGTTPHGSVRNVLMTDAAGSAFEASGINVGVEHLTLDECAQLGWNDGSANLALTNSLIVGVQLMGDIPVATNHVWFVTTNTGVFQTVGAGNYYLAANSPYRNSGITNITSSLVGELAQKTTYPPIVLSNQTVSVDTVLNPQAGRDTDLPDLGYHYDPLDYLVDNYRLTNATLTVGSGTAIAGYNDLGVVIADNAAIKSIGTPLDPNWFTEYECVQEQPLVIGTGSFHEHVSAFHSAVAPTAQYAFSKFSSLANGGYLLYHGGGGQAYANLAIANCEFWSGKNELSGANSSTAILNNNLFVRSSISALDGSSADSLICSNNLFWNEAMIVHGGANSNSWIFFNNEFDNASITFGTGTQLTVNGYNAYIGNTNRLKPLSVNDVVSTGSIAYQAGPLGYFYQPTNSILINTGSVTADLTSLYHYTTTTNQVKETNSIVDIGYHYVAVDINGIPIDTDGDGFPDYIEDANGDGSVDSGETDWQSASDLGLTVLITRPRNGSSLP